MSIRSATLQDIGALARIHGETFEEGWSLQDFDALLDTPGVAGLIALGGDGLAGGLLVMRTAVDEAEILTLAVAPRARRRGFARSLLDHALGRAGSQGVAALFLEVAIDNDSAVALYRSAGFVEVGRRPKYYGRGPDRVDALVMRRNLNSGKS